MNDKKSYYEKNKDKIKAKTKVYYQANKDKIKAYYQENKEKINKKTKAYCEANKDKIKARKKIYYLKNKEKLKAQMKAYRESNKMKKLKITPYKNNFFKLGTKYKLIKTFRLSKKDQYFRYFFANKILLKHAIPFRVEFDGEHNNYFFPMNIDNEIKTEAIKYIEIYRKNKLKMDSDSFNKWILSEIKDYNNYCEQIDQLKLKNKLINNDTLLFNRKKRKNLYCQTEWKFYKRDSFQI